MDDRPFQDVYFIGIALPDDLSQLIAELQWSIYQDKSDMLKPLVPHVTLLHPPSLKGIMPSQLIPEVRQVAARYLPLEIELTEIGFFGKQVCFIKAESHKLISLQSQLVATLPPEAKELHYKRDYLPHITLAQKYQPNEINMKAAQKTINDTLDLPIRFTVSSVSCFTRIKPRQYATKPID